MIDKSKTKNELANKNSQRNRRKWEVKREMWRGAALAKVKETEIGRKADC